MPIHPILRRFLQKQQEEGMKLAAASDLLRLQPVQTNDGPPQRYIARYFCNGLVKTADGRVVIHNRFDVGIYLPDDYLRSASTFEVLTWLYPRNVHHPNIRVPHICLGEKFFRGGMPLAQILIQLHRVIAYQRWASHAGLNLDACQWALTHQHLLPVDDRPLKRRRVRIQVQNSISEEGKQ